MFGIKNKTSKNTKTSDIDKYRFRTKFGMTNNSRHRELVSCYFGFTLAEVLITLGVVGIVAAMTLPTVITNVNERIRKEQVRTVKYKLTQATDKM